LGTLKVNDYPYVPYSKIELVFRINYPS